MPPGNDAGIWGVPDEINVAEGASTPPLFVWGHPRAQGHQEGLGPHLWF